MAEADYFTTSLGPDRFDEFKHHAIEARNNLIRLHTVLARRTNRNNQSLKVNGVSQLTARQLTPSNRRKRPITTSSMEHKNQPTAIRHWRTDNGIVTINVDGEAEGRPTWAVPGWHEGPEACFKHVPTCCVLPHIDISISRVAVGAIPTRLTHNDAVAVDGHSFSIVIGAHTRIVVEQLRSIGEHGGRIATHRQA